MFPLHFIVFKQVASHLGHEGTSEKIFSGAKNLTDPNMGPHFLGELTMMAINKKLGVQAVT